MTSTQPCGDRGIARSNLPVPPLAERPRVNRFGTITGNPNFISPLRLSALLDLGEPEPIEEFDDDDLDDEDDERNLLIDVIGSK